LFKPIDRVSDDRPVADEAQQLIKSHPLTAASRYDDGGDHEGEVVSCQLSVFSCRKRGSAQGFVVNKLGQGACYFPKSRSLIWQSPHAQLATDNQQLPPTLSYSSAF
jgi:hypothetical protein